MQTILLTMNDNLWLFAGIPVFVIVWAMVYKAIQEMPLFDIPLSKGILTTCVALLSMIGIIRYCVPGFGTADVSGDSVTRNRTVHLVLLFYSILGLAMLLIALFHYGPRLKRRGKTKALSGHVKGRPEFAGRLIPDRGDRVLRNEMAKLYDRRVMNKDTSRRPNPSDKPFVKQLHPKRISDEGKSNRIQQ